VLVGERPYFDVLQVEGQRLGVQLLVIRCQHVVKLHTHTYTPVAKVNHMQHDEACWVCEGEGCLTSVPWVNQYHSAANSPVAQAIVAIATRTPAGTDAAAIPAALADNISVALVAASGGGGYAAVATGVVVAAAVPGPETAYKCVTTSTANCPPQHTTRTTGYPTMAWKAAWKRRLDSLCTRTPGPPKKVRRAATRAVAMAARAPSSHAWKERKNQRYVRPAGGGSAWGREVA